MSRPLREGQKFITLYKWFSRRSANCGVYMPFYVSGCYQDRNGTPVKTLRPGLEFKEITGRPSICENGYHAVDVDLVADWYQPDSSLWKVRLSGQLVAGDRPFWMNRSSKQNVVKYAGTKMALIERVKLSDLPKKVQKQLRKQWRS